MSDTAPNFDDATKKELASFLEATQGQARMNAQIHQFTSMCWDKCVTGTPSTRFSRSEESCLANCVDRFLDTSMVLVNYVEQKRLETGQ